MSNVKIEMRVIDAMIEMRRESCTCTFPFAGDCPRNAAECCAEPEKKVMTKRENKIDG